MAIHPVSRLGGNVPVDDLHEISGPGAQLAVAVRTCQPTTKSLTPKYIGDSEQEPTA
jgi:hypothetical protein